MGSEHWFKVYESASLDAPCEDAVLSSTGNWN